VGCWVGVDLQGQLLVWDEDECLGAPVPRRPLAQHPLQDLQTNSTGQNQDRSNTSGQLLRRTVKRFRGGLALKAYRLLYHSTLGSRVIKKRRRSGQSHAQIRSKPQMKLVKQRSSLKPVTQKSRQPEKNRSCNHTQTSSRKPPSQRGTFRLRGQDRDSLPLSPALSLPR